jgi:hypothetical protein
MAPPKRKRFSAFDDFPASDAQTPARNRIACHSSPTCTAHRLRHRSAHRDAQAIPDDARSLSTAALLPVILRPAFFAGEMDCYQAAAEWLSLARQDGGYRAEVERLLSMGESFDAHGQIKPITGSWVPASDGSYMFLIETGERRFWAACLRSVDEGLKEEPLLRVEAVERPTRQRQVLENRHAEPPSAVGRPARSQP